MDRLIIDDLIKWKNKKDRKPLVVMGARQVGKTWIMKKFGELYYDKIAYISFYNNNRMINVFEDDYDIDRIITNLNIEVGFSITPEDTLIIFDEVQNAPKAFESLKYFCEDASQYHIMAAGSLLGVALHEGISYPVGKVEVLNLYPLNFREYLLAMGEKGLYDALNLKDYDTMSIHSDRYLFHLKNYYYVGGMPAVVEAFAERKDYNEVRDIQNNILTQYKGDFGKHIANKDIPRVNMVWESIPVQLAKENKKFFFGQIKKGARSSEFEMAIQWLCDCGLVYKVHRVNEPKVPLSFYKDFSAYKLFLIDVGLLSALSELDAKTILEGNDLFVEFKGALSEQYVLQQLVSDTKYTPYYYGSEKSRYEQDFLIQKNKDIIPIEVKAEGNIRSQSLRAFHDKYKPNLSVRFSALNYADQEWMINIPLYAVCNV